MGLDLANGDGIGPDVLEDIPEPPPSSSIWPRHPGTPQPALGDVADHHSTIREDDELVGIVVIRRQGVAKRYLNGADLGGRNGLDEAEERCNECRDNLAKLIDGDSRRPPFPPAFGLWENA